MYDPQLCGPLRLVAAGVAKFLDDRGIGSDHANELFAAAQLAITPFIGGGLVPATPSRLAQLLTEDAPAHVALKGAA